MTSFTGRLGPVLDVPRGLPAVPGDSRPGPRVRGGPALPGALGPCSMSRGVYQLSQVTPAQVLGFAVDQLYRAPRDRARCPAGSTSCPGGHRPGSECPRGRTSVPRLGPGSQVPWGQPGVPGNSHSSPRARGLDQLSWVNRAQVRYPHGWTSLPRRLGPVPHGPQCRPAFLGDSGLCPWARGVEHPFRATCAWV